MTRSTQRPHGLLKLGICVAAVLAIWLGVLPRIARLPAVDSHLRTLRENHVDAGVIFYSELDPRVFPDPDSLNRMLEERGACVMPAGTSKGSLPSADYSK